MFQSRTGSTGHFAAGSSSRMSFAPRVSIPNGLHRPFSPPTVYYKKEFPAGFQSRTGSTGHLAGRFLQTAKNTSTVSIPNGLHRPFSLADLQPDFYDFERFNPERAPQAI